MNKPDNPQASSHAPIQDEPKPSNSGELDELDIALGVCATYGTPVLGTPDQAPFIEGFEHSRTYKEAKAAIQAHIQKEVARELNNLGYDKRLDNPILYCGGEKPIPIAERIAALQNSKQIDGEQS